MPLGQVDVKWNVRSGHGRLRQAGVVGMLSEAGLDQAKKYRSWAVCLFSSLVYKRAAQTEGSRAQRNKLYVALVRVLFQWMPDDVCDPT